MKKDAHEGKKLTRRSFLKLVGAAGAAASPLLYPRAARSQKAPRGKAVVASRETFLMTGGDCHTSMGMGALNIAGLIHEGLVKRGTNGRFEPALAKSRQVSKDGLTVRFTLDERAKFHNGAPVTSQDVKFSFQRAVKPELKFRGGAELKRGVDRVEAVDDHHVDVHLKVPLPALFEFSTQFFGIVPKAYCEKIGDAEFAKHPIGAGPFRWVDYQQDVVVRAEGVADHYRKPPQIKDLEFRFAIDEATLTPMLRAGEADVVQLPPSTYNEAASDPKIRIVWSKFISGLCLAFADLAFPDEASPFHDIRVRKAASLAINRKAICEKLLHGTSEPYGDIIAPYEPGADPKVLPDPYDPEKARVSLKEAGYANGFETTFTSGHPSGDKIDIQAIAADLAGIGIRGKIIDLEPGTFVRTLFAKKIRGIFRFSSPWWTGMMHPGLALESLISSQNGWTYYIPPEVEAAWKKLSILTDEKAVAAQARELSRILRESEAKPVLWALHQPFGISPRVKSYTPIPGWMQIGGLRVSRDEGVKPGEPRENGKILAGSLSPFFATPR